MAPSGDARPGRNIYSMDPLSRRPVLDQLLQSTNGNDVPRGCRAAWRCRTGAWAALLLDVQSPRSAVGLRGLASTHHARVRSAAGPHRPHRLSAGRCRGGIAWNVEWLHRADFGDHGIRRSLLTGRIALTPGDKTGTSAETSIAAIELNGRSGRRRPPAHPYSTHLFPAGSEGYCRARNLGRRCQSRNLHG